MNHIFVLRDVVEIKTINQAVMAPRVGDQVGLFGDGLGRYPTIDTILWYPTNEWLIEKFPNNAFTQETTAVFFCR